MRLEKDHEHPSLFWAPQSGTYYFRKYLGGREVYRSLREKNRYKAIQAMNRLIANLEKELKKTDTYTIDDAILEMYGIYIHKAQATHENFNYYCRAYIAPYYAGTPIEDVAGQWEMFKAHVKEQKPGMSLRHVRKHTVAILNHAVSRGKLIGFPKLKITEDEKKKKNPRAYEPFEVKRVMSGKTKGHNFKAGTVEKQRLMVRLTLELGLRPPQEIRLLKKEYFDFRAGCLTLPAFMVKTRTARTIPVDAALIKEIQEWGDKNPLSPYLFPKRGDNTQPATRSDKTWQRLKKALGFQGKRYWFRHSHATAALEGGENAILLAKDMGTSVQMLEKIYAQPDQGVAVRRTASVRKKYGVGE